MKIRIKELPININNLSLCNQEQLNSIAHLIEAKSVSLKINPAGFIFITKKDGRQLNTIEDLATYYQKITHHILKMDQ